MSMRGLVLFHANREIFRDTIFFGEDRKDMVVDYFNDSQYDPVAHLGPEFPVESVFENTNHHEKSWTENKGVREINKTGGKRSTSVGDIILDASNRRAFVLAPIGLQELEVDKMNFDEQLGFARNGIRKDQQREHGIGRSLG